MPNACFHRWGVALTIVICFLKRSHLAWWPEVLPHLTGLRDEFTAYQLRQTHALRSVYSWKLLELLTKFEPTGWTQYTIEDFATAMEATPKQREDFAKIQTKLIEPAIRELQEKDCWLIQYKPGV